MSSFFSLNKKNVFLALSVLLFSSPLSEAKPNSFLRNLASDEPGCWIESYGRGVGKPITVCPDGLEQNGLLCYPPCKDGYTGVGPVCWQNCPSGFPDTGADCLKPASYGRGGGYAIWDQGKCANENSQGCEQWGALWYPRCAENFHNVACCVCSPNCPGDMTDIGVSCQKQSYGRGAGVPLVCPSDKDEDAALCYDKCKSGYSGVGPVCWGNCPAGKYKCGALCLESEAACTSDMLEIAGEVLKGMIEFAAELEDPVEAAITVAETGVDVGKDLAKYPICSNM